MNKSPCSFTLSTVFEMFVESKSNLLSTETKRVYAQSVNNLTSCIDDQPVCLLTRETMERWRTSLLSPRELYADHRYVKTKESRYAIPTVRKHMGHIATLLNWCVDHDDIDCLTISPMRKVPRPAEPDLPPKGTDRSTIDQLHTAIANGRYSSVPSKVRPLLAARNHAIVHTLRSTASRIGGIERLDIGDLILIDDSFEALFFEKGVHTPQQTWRFWDREATTALQKWLDLHPFRAQLRAPLFISLSGGSFGSRMKSSSIRNMLNRLKYRNGLRGRVNPHSFRHHQITRWDADHGTGIAQQLAGHRDIRMTSRYARHNRDRLRKMHRKND